MKKVLLSMIAAICMSASAIAQSHSDRISFGMGLLYENGLDATLSMALMQPCLGNTRLSTTMLGSTLSMAISNGTNASRVVISVPNLSGRTTIPGA